MYLLYNGQFLKADAFHLPLSNRSFQYGDGFFETIILKNGDLRFWDDHQARIREAASALQLELPASFLTEELSNQLKELANKNQGGPWARLKLKVWRSGQGLYTPETDAADWLATAQAATVPVTNALSVGVCRSITTLPSAFSAFKGINAPVYVLASRERMTRALDDLVLLSPQGHLAELTFSNLFWVKQSTLYTPALTTGCVNGIIRRNVLRWAEANNFAVQEGLFLKEGIMEADLAFAGNVTGLRAISDIEGVPLRQRPGLLDELRKQIS